MGASAQAVVDSKIHFEALSRELATRGIKISANNIVFIQGPRGRPAGIAIAGR